METLSNEMKQALRKDLEKLETTEDGKSYFKPGVGFPVRDSVLCIWEIAVERDATLYVVSPNTAEPMPVNPHDTETELEKRYQDLMAP